MSGAEHKEPNYMGVFWALLVLTLAEVAVFLLHPPRLVLVLSLILMALAKAGLVAAYFMHLRFESRTLTFIVISPLVLATLLIIGLTPDASFSHPRKPPTEWVLPGQEGAAPGQETAQPGTAAPGQENAQPAAPPEKKPAIPDNQANGPA
jgi:caa(3)-type oxidase subunit IV